MAWTAPRTWVAAEQPPAATLNTHIKDNLAYLKDRIQSGTVTITTVAAGTADGVITFPVAFSSAPNVIAIPITTSPQLLSTSILSGASASSATVRAYRTSGSGSVTFYWIATLG